MFEYQHWGRFLRNGSWASLSLFEDVSMMTLGASMRWPLWQTVTGMPFGRSKTRSPRPRLRVLGQSLNSYPGIRHFHSTVETAVFFFDPPLATFA